MPAENYNYSVVIQDFKNASAGDFSPGATLLFVDNPTNLAWSVYVNEVGEAFFSISQSDPKAAMFSVGNERAKLNLRPHMSIYRDGRRVWGGWVGEIDETAADIIVYGYSYESGYFDLITGFTDKWTGSNVSTIITDVLNAVKAKADSRVAWIANGTIENPWTDNAQTTGLQLPLYRANYKRALQVFKEMAAYAISDTTNHVIFEVDPLATTPTFNMWRDRKTTVANIRASYPYGAVRSYRRIRRPVNRRTKIYAVGSSPTTVTLNTTDQDATLMDQMGLSEEPLYFSFVRDATELSRVTSMRRARAGRIETDLFVSFHRNSLIPYRAEDQHFRVGDLLTVKLDNGISLIDDNYVIAGQQVIYHRNMENVRLLLASRL